MIRRFAVALVAAMLSCAPAAAQIAGFCGPSGSFDLSRLGRFDAIEGAEVAAWFSRHVNGNVPWTSAPIVFFRDGPIAPDVAVLAFVSDGKTCVIALDGADRDALLKALPGV